MSVCECSDVKSLLGTFPVSSSASVELDSPVGSCFGAFLTVCLYASGVSLCWSCFASSACSSLLCSSYACVFMFRASLLIYNPPS